MSGQVTLSKDDVVQVIIEAIVEVNESLFEADRVEPSAEAKLFGDEGGLDSIGLVNLVVAIEQQMLSRHGVELVLASERAMSQKRSPYRSVSALADYALELLAEGKSPRS